MCNKCKIEKNKSDFHTKKSTKDGLQYQCKQCTKEYYINNKEQFLKQKKQYSINNKEKIKEKSKEYYINNKEQIKEYQLKNKNKILEYNKDYQKKRRLKDPTFNLRHNISHLINEALKKQNSSKTDKSILQYLPYTINEFKQHLEKQWEPWMNWDNHGRINKNKKTWHIDHIIPQFFLPYNSMEEENFQKCWALENLRPLEAFKNIKKKNKIEFK